MRQHVLATPLLFTFVVLALAVLPALGAECSMATVSGSYGYTTSGFVTAPTGAFVPVAAAGRIVFDRKGNVSGTQTRVVAGSALDETYSGTYTVNPDCTGSFTVVVQPDTRTSTINLVWTDSGNGVSAVFTNPGFTLTSTARRIVLKD